MKLFLSERSKCEVSIGKEPREPTTNRVKTRFSNFENLLYCAHLLFRNSLVSFGQRIFQHFPDFPLIVNIKDLNITFEIPRFDLSYNIKQHCCLSSRSHHIIYIKFIRRRTRVMIKEVNVGAYVCVLGANINIASFVFFFHSLQIYLHKSYTTEHHYYYYCINACV